MKLASHMTEAEKEEFKRRPDVQKEKAIAIEYIQMLKKEADAFHNEGKMPTEDFYCLLRSALGFEILSMRDKRAPNLKIIGPYLWEEIDAVCKKPRVTSVSGHLIVPQIIPELNSTMNGGKRHSKTRHRTSRSKRTRINH